MRVFQARLTVVKGPVYAYDQRMKVGTSIVKTVTAFDPEQLVKGKDGKLSNPKGYEGYEVGYRDVPCPGCFRIEEINTNPAQRIVTLQERIIEALGKLDHQDPTLWTSKGEPKADVVSTLVGDRVTREEIEDALPSFKRQVNER